MNFKKLTLAALFSIGALGWMVPLPVKADDGIMFKVQLPGTNYCHLKFPEIRPETLSREHPVLQNPNTGAIIDFYGPCDYDPTGKAAVQAQRLAEHHRWSHYYAE